MLTVGCAAEIVALGGVASRIGKGEGAGDYGLGTERLALPLAAVLGLQNSGYIVVERQLPDHPAHPYPYPIGAT